MNRLQAILKSSIGKKEIMALTGLSLIAFLLIHLGGNLSIYAGGSALDGWADFLHSFGIVVRIFEAGLALIFLVHIFYGLTLWLQNNAARPVAYQNKVSEGGRSWGSATQIYTGVYIGVFILVHLVNFAAHSLFYKDETSLSQLVAANFQQPGWMVYYVVTMFLVGLHISHGFWSALQTLGFEALRVGPYRTTSNVLSWIFALGFGALPLVVGLQWINF